MSKNYGPFIPGEWSKSEILVIFRVHDDPDGTIYPDSLLPINLKNVWHYPYVSPTDRPIKERTKLVW